jgi:GDPmannose 4,6-dehydratase
MKALITGILGQDGYYLSKILKSNGYDVFGLVREDTKDFRIHDSNIIKVNICDKNKLYDIIGNIKPDIIYNLASFSNVFNPWDNLDDIFKLNSKVPQDILECILKIDKNIKFFQASSCLIYGRSNTQFQNELTPTSPIYPYGITKLYADNMVKEYRETFGLYACSGIFYNHESERRPNNFFSKKITEGVSKIYNGKLDVVKVGDLSSKRDFGYAPDFMDAVHKMMCNKNPTDYVIGTGELISMLDFTKKCFEYVGLDYVKYIDIDVNMIRKNETNVLRADISKINNELGWSPSKNIDQIISTMMDYDLKNNI